MPTAYSPEAIELARSLYCKYGGRNFDAIEREMQKQYPGWRKTNLSDRGKKRIQFGWITNYGFDNSLKLHIQKLTEKVNDDEQGLYVGIKTIRQRLEKAAIGDTASKDDLAKYRDFCKLEIEARRNLNLTRDNFETFVSGYEKLCIWAPNIDPQLAKLLAKYGDKLAQLAQAHYGKEESEYDGTIDREDEGSDEPFSLLN